MTYIHYIHDERYNEVGRAVNEAETAREAREKLRAERQLPERCFINTFPRLGRPEEYGADNWQAGRR